MLSDANTTAGAGLDRPSSAVIAPDGSGLPVTSWNLVGYSDGDGDDATARRDSDHRTSPTLRCHIKALL
ncbi:hypothetical protein [Streptacidiphilus sp. PAMC 29251]